MWVECLNVSVTFHKRVVLNPLSLSLAPGQVVGLVGPNGAGKTSLMKKMMDLIPGNGSVLFDGKPLGEVRAEGVRISALFDLVAAHPNRRAIDHLEMVAGGSGLSREDAYAALDQVGLGTSSRSRPKHYSLGMKRRLALAAALVVRPQVLLLDEPTNGLDIEAIFWVREAITEFAAQGNVVLLSTHAFTEIEAVAHRVIGLREGSKIIDISRADLERQAHAASLTRVESPDANVLTAALTKEGWRVVESGSSHLVVEMCPPEVVGEIAFQTSCRIFGLSATDMSLQSAYEALSQRSLQKTSAESPHNNYPKEVHGRLAV